MGARWLRRPAGERSTRNWITPRMHQPDFPNHVSRNEMHSRPQRSHIMPKLSRAGERGLISITAICRVGELYDQSHSSRVPRVEVRS
jgi:hypothetical protein